MAELIWVNLSGIIEDSAKNDLAKQIFAKIKKIKKLQYLGSPVFLVATHAKAKQNRQVQDNMVSKVRLCVRRGTAVIYLISYVQTS